MHPNLINLGLRRGQHLAGDGSALNLFAVFEHHTPPHPFLACLPTLHQHSMARG